jgi:hypothetical protein
VAHDCVAAQPLNTLLHAGPCDRARRDLRMGQKFPGGDNRDAQLVPMQESLSPLGETASSRASHFLR